MQLGDVLLVWGGGIGRYILRSRRRPTEHAPAQTNTKNTTKLQLTQSCACWRPRHPLNNTTLQYNQKHVLVGGRIVDLPAKEAVLLALPAVEAGLQHEERGLYCVLLLFWL